MALKAYYDGSGKTDNPDAEFLTLAGYAGFDPVWPMFDRLWLETLADRNPPAQYLHMVDATSLQKGFKRENGWDKEKVSELVLACCFCITRITSKLEYRDKFKAFSCTVDLKAYNEVKQEFGELVPAEKICVDAAVKQMLWEGRRELRDGQVNLYFDQNESFMRHIYREWTKKKSERPKWAGMVTTIAPTPMQQNPGLQAADMHAWLLNRHFSKGDLGTWAAVVNLFLDNADRQHAGYKEIREYHLGEGSS